MLIFMSHDLEFFSKKLKLSKMATFLFLTISLHILRIPKLAINHFVANYLGFQMMPHTSL